MRVNILYTYDPHTYVMWIILPSRHKINIADHIHAYVHTYMCRYSIGNRYICTYISIYYMNADDRQKEIFIVWIRENLSNYLKNNMNTSIDTYMYVLTYICACIVAVIGCSYNASKNNYNSIIIWPACDKVQSHWVGLSSLRGLCTIYRFATNSTFQRSANGQMKFLQIMWYTYIHIIHICIYAYVYVRFMFWYSTLSILAEMINNTTYIWCNQRPHYFLHYHLQWLNNYFERNAVVRVQ